jgi:acetylornithine aminotransferase
MGALSLTGQPTKRDPFKPLIKGIKHVPFGDISALKKAINKKTAMFIVEPMQGENGVVVPPLGYLRAAREITQDVGAMFVVDAVQTGMGRTGSWFGYEHEGITPDVITLAKGLGGGIPLGATIALGKYAQLFTPGTHGSTFGGSPVACAAANATIDFMVRENILERNVESGRYLKSALSTVGLVEHVRGEGLLIGAVLKNPVAKKLAADLLAAGVIVNAANESVIRIAPPMVITRSLLEEFISIFTKVCAANE